MRTSTNYQFDRFSAYIQAANERVAVQQERIATGKRIMRPADDPVGASLALNLRKLRSGVERYNANLAAAKDYLGNSEAALGEAHTLIQKAYELAVRGANSSVDQAGRNASAAEVREIQRRLVEIANSRGNSNQFIFAGQLNDAKPFSVSGNALVYSGDANDVTVEVGPDETMPVNVSGGDLFVDAYAALETLKTNLESGDIGAIGGSDIDAMHDTMDRFMQTRGAVGARLQRVDLLESHNLRRIDELGAKLSEVEDVDVAQAIMDLRAAETAYEAALHVTSRGFATSLMDFLR